MTSQLFARLSNKIFETNEFRNDYVSLLKQRLANSHNLQDLSQDSLKKLLESAAIFALTDKNEFQKIAFNIAVFSLESFKKEFETLPIVSQLILARMGDLPTINHMIESNDSDDFFSFFKESEASPQWLKFSEITAVKTFNQVYVGKLEQNLTDFQIKILNALRNKWNVSFSAPTSAGKSFIVHQYIAEKLVNETYYCVVYLVPTRSLIKETQDNIANNLKKFSLTSDDVLIFSSVSTLNINKITNIKKKILVMTQERLQQMISNEQKIMVDLLVVDEAQKVSEEGRGIIIEDAVQDLIGLNPSLQKIFISPNTKNLHEFKEIFNISEKLETFNTTKTPVGQNIFDIRFIKTENKADVSLLVREFNEETIPLYSTSLEKGFKSHLISPRKAWVVNNIIKRQDPTIIYCDTRKDCRTVCDYIAKKDDKFEPSDVLKKNISFVKDHVHHEYYLVDYLRNGIGYHYGKMPHFVRLVIKDLYENKEIDTLCCTSTLVEGVNLPAKNIVLFNPKLGRDIPMDRSGIRNIAGRAGRLTKDYYGNIYCIDRKDWKEQDVFKDELDIIQSAIEKTLSNKTKQVIDYLVEPIQSDEVRGPINVAISLMMKYLRNPSMIENYLDKKSPSLDQASKDTILNYLEQISIRISNLDTNVILKNRDFDPRFQYELFNYVMTHDLILPPYPTADDFYAKLLEIFRLISTLLLRSEKQSYVYYTNLAWRWINGRPYKYLLDDKIKRNKPLENESHKTFVNRMIDDLDDELENVIKFHYTRGLQCYCDIVEHVQKITYNESTFCKELPEYLEAGAYDPRIFVLLDCGFTRISALYLYTNLPNDITNIQDCIKWLKKNRNHLKEWLPESLLSEAYLILDK